MNISPAAAPSPLFRYRLHPVAGKLMPGNAAPIYLRIRYGISQTSWDEIDKKSTEWLKLPVEKLPVKEARSYVDGWAKQLKQIEIGTRRDGCDWGYSIAEQRTNFINILLPDAQEMRNWGRLIALKARVEIAEGDLGEAVHTLGTGIAFGRHVGNGPLVLNGLIGIALETSMLVQLEYLVGRPGAPNLYWALTAIPRPLIPLRDQMEREQRLAENMIPEMNDVFASHPPAEWTIVAGKIYDGMHRLARLAGLEEVPGSKVRTILADDYTSYKKKYLEILRSTLQKTPPNSQGSVAAMSDDEVMARGIVNQYRVMRDGIFKIGYLPYADQLKRLSESEASWREGFEGPVGIFAVRLGDVNGAMMAELLLERRIAMLRTIEAIRLHAAASDGKLPDSLDAITEVPIPLDPTTDKPFPFSREGATALLANPRAGLRTTRPNYRITIRK